jgi:glycerophosphoryl diester phosphodiesterase
MSLLSRIPLAAAILAAPVLLQPSSAAQAAPIAPSAHERSGDPVVIGHRGAPGYRPEHTLASYRLAIRLGANYIEPDLVSTKDGVLVARHENEISGTTDVADHPEFAALRTTKVVDGVSETGWFTEDLTLAQLKTLRAKERLPQVRPDNTRYDGRFEVPTLDQVLNLARSESHRTGRTIGVYPETKHPTYFDSIGLSLEEPLLRALRHHHLSRPRSKVIIQSFETGNLRELNRLTDVRLVQLLDASGAPYDFTVAGDPRTYSDLATRASLAWIGSYADGIGANKNLVLPRDPVTGATGTPSALVGDAHAAGLVVHVWTLRDENQFMATNFRRGTDPNAKGDSYSEAIALLDAGVDGIFSDQPDTTFQAREDWLASR